ncbi:hypothetical protein ScPMuIL_016481 [Solemya velum]
MNVNDALKLLSAFTGGIAAGGSIYIHVIEHPSRRAGALPVPMGLKNFRNTFAIAGKVMPSLGITHAVLTGSLYFLEDSEDKWQWLIPPAVVLLTGAWTVLAMIPEINELFDDKVVEKKGDGWVAEALDRWNKKHALRTVIRRALDGGAIVLQDNLQDLRAKVNYYYSELCQSIDIANILMLNQHYIGHVGVKREETYTSIVSI